MVNCGKLTVNLQATALTENVTLWLTYVQSYGKVW